MVQSANLPKAECRDDPNARANQKTSSQIQFQDLRVMPYSIQKVPGGYYVITTATKKRHSSYPLTYEQARRQLIALKIHTGE